MRDFAALLKGVHSCECGRDHNCPVEYVYIGTDMLACLQKLTADFRRIVLVADENTYEAQGRAVEWVLGARVESSLVYPGAPLLVPDETAVACLDKQVTEQTQLILGVGSGVINDICKYVSYQHNLPYYIVATAPSMDGYASNNAALILNGMKISPSARPPKAIFSDTSVLKNAPLEMIQAGYGDIMGKLSCLNDWKLAKLINREYFCQYVYDLTMQTVQQLQPLAEDLLSRNDEAVGLLMEALVTVGIAMSFVGNSRPASGSEHHLSHFFEIRGIVHGHNYYPHGIDVVYSAVLTAQLRRKILRNAPVGKIFDRERWLQEMKRVYGSVADGVIALQDQLDNYAVFSRNIAAADWHAVCACLSEAPDEQTMLDIVNRIGLSYEDFQSFYGESVLKDAVAYGKDLKDRFTVLWLHERFFV